MITMPLAPTPPSPFHPAAILLRNPRRSPGATPQSSQIATPQRPQQPIGSPEPVIIMPTLPFNLLTGSCHRLSDHALR